MQQLRTKYITLDEFEEYFGIDLRAELQNDMDAIRFLKRIEDRLATFCDSKFNTNIDMKYPNFTDYQKLHYKRALLEQAIYIFKNGDISVDSGYDPEKGEIARTERYAIAPNCKDELRLCGIWNRNIPNMAGGIWLTDAWWLGKV